MGAVIDMAESDDEAQSQGYESQSVLVNGSDNDDTDNEGDGDGEDESGSRANADVDKMDSNDAQESHGSHSVSVRNCCVSRANGIYELYDREKS